MLVFTRRFLPDLLRDTEAWHASGRKPASSPAEREAAAAAGHWLDRLMPAMLAANTRTNGLVEQGRTAAIIERLTAWGLWQEPDPPPPDAAIILDRLEALWE